MSESEKVYGVDCYENGGCRHYTVLAYSADGGTIGGDGRRFDDLSADADAPTSIAEIRAFIRQLHDAGAFGADQRDKLLDEADELAGELDVAETDR
jgi:hypothetical protein